MGRIERDKGLFHPLEGVPREKRLEDKWDKTAALVSMAAKKSNEFRARLAENGIHPGDIKSAKDFQSVPVLRKKDIIRLQKENGLQWMLTAPLGKIRRIYQSPGPIFDPETDSRDGWGWAEAFFACGFRADDLAQITFSYHLTPAGLMLEEPLRTLGCCCIPAGPGNTEKQIELLTGLPVTGFVGMASYLKIIGKKARSMGLNPEKDFGLEVAFVAAERLTDSLRREVEDLFNIRVRQGYGTADVGCIAYECPELGGMHISSRCWVEICHPDTGRVLPDGETGEVVVTAYNPDYPLIRLATGDISVIDTGFCACGRTSRKLRGILGRVDDTAKVKGQFIYPSQAKAALNGFPQIRRWQIAISNPGGRDILTLRIQTRSGIDPTEVARAFQKAVKLKPEIVNFTEDCTLSEDSPLLVDERQYD
ncbi:MAG: phenylacetate--CoA ligase family protein [Desulfonatronovibrionaceae bacterium]